MKNKNYSIDNIPKHVAIIMDGNGTWAKKRGLPRNLGHRKGAKTLIDLVSYANKIGIKYLTVYAFSTENWSRPKEEVNYLMKLPMEFIDDNKDRLEKEQIRFHCIGKKEELPSDVQQKIVEFEKKTKDYQGLNFIIAFNYGGHDEIVNAVNNIIKDNITNLDKETFEKYLYTKDFPPVDLMIRTSGQVRISNFLLWQLAYSEMYFTKTLWPDFKSKDLDKAIEEYVARDRRYGGLK